MKALIQSAYGPPENLRFEDRPIPEPGAGEVLVQVMAASVNSWDWDLVLGKTLARLGSPFKPPHEIIGADIAGIVAAVGAGVDDLQVGDAVFGDLSSGNWGGFAEYVVARASDLAVKPDHLDWVAAAALPQAGLLMQRAFDMHGPLEPGDVVLFNGAGGGVGTMAVQVAKAAGAEVIAVDSADKREPLLALGVDRFIDYRRDDYTALGLACDLIIDVVAARSLSAHARSLRPGGDFIVIGGTSRTILATAALGWLYRRHGRLRLLIHQSSRADLLRLAASCAAGTMRPIIDSTYPLADAIAALRRLGDGQAVGKVVITMPALPTGTQSPQSS